MSELHLSLPQVGLSRSVLPTANKALSLNGLQVQVKLMSDTAITFMASNQPITVDRRQVSGQLQTGHSYQFRQITPSQYQLMSTDGQEQRQPLSANLSSSLAPKVMSVMARQHPEPVSLRGTVDNLNREQITVRLSTGQQLRLPAHPALSQLTPGQPLNLELVQSQSQWQLRITPVRSQAMVSASEGALSKLLAGSQQSGASGQTVHTQATLLRADGKHAILRLDNGQSVKLPSTQSLMQFRVGETLDISANQVRQQWQVSITAANAKPLATLPLQPKQVTAIAPLVVKGDSPVRVTQHQLQQWQQQLLVKPIKQELGQLLKAAPGQLNMHYSGQGRLEASWQNHSRQPAGTLTMGQKSLQQLQSLRSDTNIGVRRAPTGNRPIGSLNIQQILPRPEVMISEQGLKLSPQYVPRPVSPIVEKAQSATPELRQQIVTLLRQLQSQQQSPAQTLNQLNAALESLNADKTLGQWVDKASEQLRSGLPQGSKDDLQALRQLLSSPALNLTPSQLTLPANQGGFMGGLITLLQIALSARLGRQRPDQATKLMEGLSELMNSRSVTSPATASPGRSFNDFAQLEQRHQLLKQLGSLLSQHQSSKVSAADGAIQGQELFHYTLPLGSEPRRDVELLIKREDLAKESHSSLADTNKRWNLTMKLTVTPEQGLLAKARLYQQDVELHLYTDHPGLKTKVSKYLPLLQQRLESMGLNVHKAVCEMGQIPATLKHQPYHLFETQA